MIFKAQRIVATSRNYKVEYKGRGALRHQDAIVFNVSKYVVGGQGILGSEVTDRRAEKFLHSLSRRFPRGITALELEFELLSLRRVTVKHQNYPDPFELVPIWSAATIQQLREFLHCTCEGFVRSGWVCSHIQATLSILELLDLPAALASVPVRRTPCRPRSRGEALQVEPSQDGFYNINRLVRLFLRQPGQPLKWKVGDNFDMGGGDATETGMVIGQVIGLRLADGVYKWAVRFDNDITRDYEAEDLAQAVNRAHNLSVRVSD